MANNVSLRTIELQMTDKEGKPYGEKCFGFILSDNYNSAYVDSFDSLEERNTAIEFENLNETLNTYVDCDQLILLKDAIKEKGGLTINGHWIPMEKAFKEED